MVMFSRLVDVAYLAVQMDTLARTAVSRIIASQKEN